MEHQANLPRDARPPDRGEVRNRRRTAKLNALIPALLAFLFVLPGTAFAQDCITELRVVAGGSSGVPAPAGFTRIGVDLNQGASGLYIYLCYKRGVGAPITGLAVTVDDGAPPADAAYTRINADLNAGAGGEYIWLWYTKDPGCSTVRDLHVQANTGAPPAGFTRINVDLNMGAGGAYIYLSYLEL